jgi:hypothetical protein
LVVQDSEKGHAMRDFTVTKPVGAKEYEFEAYKALLDYSPGVGTRLYRVTAPDTTWPTPQLGRGAYFTHGGRYNRAGQATV